MAAIPGAIPLEAANELRGEVLRVGCAPAVAEHEDFPACAVPKT